MKPGKYQFSEDFLSWFRPLCEERVRREAAKAAGTYEAGSPVEYPVDPDPPSAKQLAFVKRLGAKTVPKTKKEASDMISELLKKKDEA